MRETKFKAWDIKNKGWIQGFNMLNYHDYYNKGLDASISRYYTNWKKGEYILAQYTGLKDIDGKEIYSEDIVNVTFPNGGFVRAVIEWKDLSWQYKTLFALSDSLDSKPLFNNPYPNYAGLHCVGYIFKIIGNIYEHSNLLGDRS